MKLEQCELKQELTACKDWQCVQSPSALFVLFYIDKNAFLVFDIIQQVNRWTAYIFRISMESLVVSVLE